MLNPVYKVIHVYPYGPAIESCDCYWNNCKYDKEELKIMLLDSISLEGHFLKRCLNDDDCLDKIQEI